MKHLDADTQKDINLFLGMIGMGMVSLAILRCFFDIGKEFAK
jgi:hypothetical protein